jgi:protein-L-isoaspartate(D-aspartate) O-methyltransferase
MTELLSLGGEEKVLEIGTGSGYQSAILAELAKEVCTVERIPQLLAKARDILTILGYKNIKYKIGDGTLGWQEESPFDGIIVTAGAPDIPSSLLEQLKEEVGVIIIPVGDERIQQLLYVKKERGGLIKREICGCVFVKLLGKEGWKE